MLSSSGAPLVLTEYYLQDTNLNIDKLKDNTDKEVDVVLPPVRNPHCSQLAARIPAGFAMRQFGRGNVLMSNDYIAIVKCGAR